MIAGFRSRALKRFWTRGDEAAIRPDWRNKVRIVLSRLDAASHPGEMNLPGMGFHPLKGSPQRYAITVSRNWRITFGWQGENAIEVELEDYHGR
jgi:proteic killer suppression protein